MTTPIQLLEGRIAYYHALEPMTPEGIRERDAMLHELNNLVFTLQIEAVNALHRAVIEAELLK